MALAALPGHWLDSTPTLLPPTVYDDRHRVGEARLYVGEHAWSITLDDDELFGAEIACHGGSGPPAGYARQQF